MSPSGGTRAQLFPPLGGGQRGRKVFFGVSVGFPPLEELKLSCFPLLEGDEGGGKFCFGRAFWISPSGGAEDEVFPPLEGDKGGGFFLYKEEKIVINPKLQSCNPLYYLGQSLHLNFTGILFNITRITGDLTRGLKFYI